MNRWRAPLLALLMTVTATASGATDPRELIMQVTETTLAKVEAERAVLKENPKKLNALVRDILLPHFDFVAMSQSTLGKHWRTADQSERDRFVIAFRSLLVRTYATALLDYGGQQVDYLPMGAIEDTTNVTVRTEIAQPGGLALPIHYRLHLVDDRWLVFDVAIEGVSLITNYRTTFSSEIRSTSLEAVIEKLETRNREDMSG